MLQYTETGKRTTEVLTLLLETEVLTLLLETEVLTLLLETEVLTLLLEFVPEPGGDHST